jgi:hypothetical protein
MENNNENTLEILKEKLALLNTKKPAKNTKEYSLAYYHKHHQVKCTCVCGKETTMTSIYRHRFSKKHILIMEKMELEKQIKTLEESKIDNL